MKASRTLRSSRPSIRSAAPARVLRATALLLVSMIFLGALPSLAAEGPGVVNINTATTDQLAQLPRVGPALAQRIVDFREENGEFAEASDLTLVRGIGDKTFQMLETFVTVKGDTTLTRKLKTSDVPRREEEDSSDSSR